MKRMHTVTFTTKEIVEALENYWGLPTVSNESYNPNTVVMKPSGEMAWEVVYHSDTDMR